MRVRFCETTSDITFLISSKEVLELKRTKSHTPVLEARDKGLVFHLINSCSVKPIKVKEPGKSYPHCWVIINDQVYNDLIRDNHCGTRYGSSSKVNVIIDNYFQNI